MHRVVSPSEYEHVQSVMSMVVYSNKVFPDYVFKDLIFSCFVEFDNLFSRDFVSSICRLGVAAGDDRIFMVAIEPDQFTYFYNNFRVFQAISFSPHDDVDEVLSGIYRGINGNPAESMAINSASVLVVGSSLSWAMYGERNLEALAVSAKRELHASVQDAIDSKYQFSVDEFIDDVLFNVFFGTMPDSLVTGLKSNYRT